MHRIIMCWLSTQLSVYLIWNFEALLNCRCYPVSALNDSSFIFGISVSMQSSVERVLLSLSLTCEVSSYVTLRSSQASEKDFSNWMLMNVLYRSWLGSCHVLSPWRRAKNPHWCSAELACCPTPRQRLVNTLNINCVYAAAVLLCVLVV